MATLDLTFSLTFDNQAANSAPITIAPAEQSIVISGDRMHHTTQTIGVAAENLEKGDIVNIGYALLHNTDPTNFVEVGYDDGGFRNVIKIKKGEWGLVRLAQNIPQARADTAPVNLDYYLIED